ncbi:cysteine tRNA synthetase (Cysteine--tRNA ligase) [Bradyrhizobium sp. ORS 375]|uniref:cysteine--tRNA ligase n=1 Tax=Bradyrhizobium sp. (strain ORS 375) TaxID=566679 RepID=UPI0002408B70|nr:cysteine--tRNA ligase [Bradyrhizobium sp. ORS 375]CCD93859.1 cysteine tRNA synthetase (Cysteine--tRNA ligase) [Bradyrhizobium sp. ORS 375]
MDLRLYDTASREKRPFVPLDPDNVRMYVCGPTVYDFAHIGNARPVIVFDVLFRLLRHVYGQDHVTYVRNITDVDDKINARAARDFPGLPLNEAIRKVTEVTANQFHSDAAALGSLPPTFEPRATEFVLPRPDGKADMVSLIKQLIARGHAYEAGGEVLFDTVSMPDYGALSGRKLEDQLAGARVAVDAHKKNPADFVLWKQSSADEPGWDSPWGRGRPGWHIECSAMSAAYLGEVFDIHGGGLDLIFPHHENEIAQSRCAHGTSVMANYWLHNEFVQVEGAKMSKSLGNFVTIRDLLADWPGEVLRLNMLKMHYRSPADWTVKGLEESAKTLDDWYRVAADAPGETPEPAVVNALLDDINTPLMIAELHALRSRAASGGEAERAAFAGSLRYFGFLSDTSAKWEARKQQAKGVDAAKVDGLIADRTAARARKDFKESDRIRDELAAMGVVLKDGKGADGKPVTTWEIAR